MKLRDKGADLIVANDVSSRDIGFASDDNRVVFIDANGEEALEVASKDEIAHRICSKIGALLSRASDPAVKVAE